MRDTSETVKLNCKTDTETHEWTFQPCWSCTKATGFCKWSHDEEPIEGWEAVGTNRGAYDSYDIIYCPEYEFDEKIYSDNYIRRLKENGMLDVELESDQINLQVVEMVKRCMSYNEIKSKLRIGLKKIRLEVRRAVEAGLLTDEDLERKREAQLSRQRQGHRINMNVVDLYNNGYTEAQIREELKLTDLNVWRNIRLAIKAGLIQERR